MIKRSLGTGILALTIAGVALAQQKVPPQQPVPPQKNPAQPVPPQQPVPPKQGTPQQPMPPQQKAPVVNNIRGQVVNVDPDKGIVRLRTGMGQLAKEFEYRVNANTRFWGPDRAAFANGLNYAGFRPGATIWYQLDGAENNQYISQMRFYDPAQEDRKVDAPAPVPTPAPDVRGQIVQVDPAKNTLTVRTADGEAEFRVGDKTRYWNANKVQIAEGLTYRGLRPGVTVWLRLGMADNAPIVAELRLFDPALVDADLRGQIVRVGPDKNIFVVKTGVGEVEYRVTSTTRYWDANRVAFVNGLRNASFREGANVWFRLGTVDNARVVTELRFHDPAQPEVVPDLRGQVVRVDPDRKTMRLLVGEANLAKEVEYTVNADTRFWDANKVNITEGLAYSGFRQGVPVWFRIGANANVVTEVRFYDPGPIGVIAKNPDAKVEIVPDVRGRIVRVDPDKNIVILRTGEGPTAKEVEYRINDTTRFWGPDRVVVPDGLRYRGLQPNAEVWYRVRTIDNVPVMTELRLYDPTVIKGRP